MTLEEVNLMDEAAFTVAFGEVVEHSPWVAEGAGRRRPFPTRDAMIAAFTDTLLRADHKCRLAVLRAHPDLAGKAALAGALTEDSTNEQAGAGLNALSEQEYDRFGRLNGAYREKFAIPFIFAVKGATKQDILDAFEHRLENNAEQEIETALQQVCRIIRFRVEERVTS